jgi:putative DNA primase/helicase
MLRRGLISRLDAGMERPELRRFRREDPVRILKRERGRYVAAALTVLRGHIATGASIKAQPLGGFEGWSIFVRNALLWLDEADPVTTIEAARVEDPARQKLEAVITQWRTVLDNSSVTTRMVVEEACGFTLAPMPGNPNHISCWHSEFRNALLDVANERGQVSVGRLGKWLSANKHKVVGDDRLAADTPSAGDRRWRLERRQIDGTWR